MNKLLLLFLCVCLVGCSSTSTTTVPTTIQENEQEQIKPRDLHVVALGDSLTKGVGDGKGGYVTFIKQYLEQREDVNKVFVQNFGKRGCVVNN